jgi:hypothetical protein
MKQPQSRYSTRKACLEISSELDLPYDEFAQDWPWEVADPDDIEKYIAHYSTLKDEDKKFVLMEAILQACDELEPNDLEKYWPIVRDLLLSNFSIHESSIFYWSCFENDLDNSFEISSNMRLVAEDGCK